MCSKQMCVHDATDQVGVLCLLLALDAERLCEVCYLALLQAALHQTDGTADPTLQVLQSTDWISSSQLAHQHLSSRTEREVQDPS